MKTSIVVRLTYEGVHCWKGCDIEEVLFLRNEHRHIFHITAKKEVYHDDRQIEIICLKRKILSYLNKYKGNFGTMSCEMIAKELLNEFELNYCQVLEDNENGAEITK